MPNDTAPTTLKQQTTPSTISAFAPDSPGARMSPDDRAEMLREAAESDGSVSLDFLFDCGTAPLAAGRAILALLDARGFSAVLLALLVYAHRRGGDPLREAVAFVVQRGLVGLALGSKGSSPPSPIAEVLAQVPNPWGEDRRALELYVRRLIRTNAANETELVACNRTIRLTLERAAIVTADDLDLSIDAATRWWDEHVPAEVASNGSAAR